MAEGEDETLIAEVVSDICEAVEKAAGETLHRKIRGMHAPRLGDREKTVETRPEKPGVRIEKFMWGSWTPAKVKMAVSGCPRNCAEATCKDVGVVCVDSGFEIHFAGAAGRFYV